MTVLSQSTIEAYVLGLARMVGGQGTGSALAEALVEQSCDRIGVDAATELVLGTGVAYLGYGDVDP